MRRSSITRRIPYAILKKTYPMGDDFFDYFHEQGVVFEYDNEEEEVIFDYPHQNQEMAAATNDQPSDKFNKNTWLCDSAATSHMKNSIEGMTNLEPCVKKIIVGDGKEIYSTHIGTFSALAVQKDGNTSIVILKDTYLAPDLWVNLFSLTKALTKGSKLSNQVNLSKLSVEIQVSLLTGRLIVEGAIHWQWKWYQGLALKQ